MRRLLVVLVLATLTLGLAPSALAGAPTKERSVFTQDFLSPAGTLCDFDYRQTATVKQDFFSFGDPDDPTKMVWQTVSEVTHINVATEFVLTEKVSVSDVFYPGTAIEKLVGIAWHLRGPDGKLVTVHAGQMLFDWSSGGPVTAWYTPNMDPDFAAVICPALGGNPA